MSGAVMARPVVIMNVDTKLVIKFKELCSRRGVKDSEALEAVLRLILEANGTNIINDIAKYVNNSKTLETLTKLLG